MHLAVMCLPLRIWEIPGSVLGLNIGYLDKVLRGFPLSAVVAISPHSFSLHHSVILPFDVLHIIWATENVVRKNHNQINRQTLSRSPRPVVTFQDLFDYIRPWAFTVRTVVHTAFVRLHWVCSDVTHSADFCRIQMSLMFGCSTCILRPPFAC
jgi:hypothetical protein